MTEGQTKKLKFILSKVPGGDALIAVLDGTADEKLKTARDGLLKELPEAAQKCWDENFDIVDLGLGVALGDSPLDVLTNAGENALKCIQDAVSPTDVKVKTVLDESQQWNLDCPDNSNPNRPAGECRWDWQVVQEPRTYKKMVSWTNGYVDHVLKEKLPLVFKQLDDDANGAAYGTIATAVMEDIGAGAPGTKTIALIDAAFDKTGTHKGQTNILRHAWGAPQWHSDNSCLNPKNAGSPSCQSGGAAVTSFAQRVKSWAQNPWVVAGAVGLGLIVVGGMAVAVFSPSKRAA